MTTMSHRLNRIALAAALALGAPVAVHAQELPYNDVADGGDEGADAGQTDGGAARTPHVSFSPYIEATQVLLAQLSPGSDTLTYTTLAAGVDAVIAGRNNQGAVSLRYERRFGWGEDALDSDTLSGVARFQTAIVPRAINFEVGAMAARSSVENNGSTVNGIELGNSTNIYSAYAGPSVATRAGDVMVNGHYYFGYTKVEQPDALVVVPGQNPVDLFDSSTRHNAELHFGTKAGEPLPVGLGVGAGYNREDISNLDQRIEDRWVRGDVAVPVTPELQLVGGVGYEKVQVSSRDALRDAVSGAPVTGTDGRYVTNKAAPRTIAFDAQGLIWDAGVMWRPNRRLSLNAQVGHRYGTTSYFGTFAYAPSERSRFNVAVYDTIDGVGGQLGRALAGLPAEFEAVRNPFNGSFGGCVATSGDIADGQSPCLANALGSVRSSVFRARGVTASYGFAGQHLQFGVGAGYDRRKFLAAPGTVLAAANGVIDENIWVAAYLNGRIDRNSSFSTSVHGNLFESGDALAGETTAIGATAAYYRQLTRKLTASAAVGVDGIKRENLPEAWSGQAVVGLRYSF